MHLDQTVSRWRVTALAVLAAAGSGVAAAQAPASYLVQISVDGLAGLSLQALLAATPQTYPNLHRLVSEGAGTFNARCDYHYSETLQNHVCMWTGRPVLRPIGQPATVPHGFVYNFTYPGWTLHNMGNPAVGYVASGFDVAHDHGLSTAFFAGKEKLGICPSSYDWETGAADLTGEDNGPNKVDFALVTEWDSGALVRSLLEQLASAPPRYTFLHLVEPDLYGHWYGWGSPIWNAIVGVVDGYLGVLLAAIESNPQLAGRTTLILTADHGGGYPPYGHSEAWHQLNYTVPLLVWGPGWPAGANLYDLFANRFNPGATRPDYTAAQQPLRNGDAANLAMLALNLPPVPGSTLRPQPGTPQVRLTFQAAPSGLLLSWPSPSTDFVLETSTVVGPGAVWTTVESGITDDGLAKSLLVPDPTQEPHRFYRLRKQ